MSAADLLAELDATRSFVEAGEDVDIAGCEALIARVNQHASHASRADLEMLQAGVQALTEAVYDRMDEIDDKLKKIRDGHRGVHGYARLRSHSTAQRLRKRV
ncbi:MAG: hypothetical protein VX265_05825 [Myxococcota bacterium]|nr:hypothetical protein [Myxococcota bacterium]